MISERLRLDEPEQRLRRACAELDKALRGGEATPAERLLKEWPDLASHTDLAVELIYTEYATREELGQQPVPADYFTRFPEWQERLARLFDVDALLKSDPAATSQSFGTNWGETWHRPALVPGDDTLPPRLGAYDLQEKIGSGGMGVVYKAWHCDLKREVAIKLLRTGPLAEDTDRQRFRQEAQTIAQVRHPNIIEIHEIGEHEGGPFLVLEYIAGGNLRQALRQQPIAPEEAARLVATLAHAVQFAHDCGVIHRDLKPANVLLAVSRDPQRSDSTTEDPQLSESRLAGAVPKLTDFGLAARMDQELSTASGRIVGTASYMAPEQAAAKKGWVTPAVDVYALGAILYEALTGRVPFLGDNDLETLRQVLTEEPVSPRRLQPKVPADLDVITLKCLAKEPGKRYPAARALAEDLECWLDQRPISARPAGRWERAVKWSRRHPTAAALMSVSLLAIIAIVVLNLGYLSWLNRAYQEAHTAQIRAEKSEQETKDALAEEARRRKQARDALDALTSEVLESFLLQQQRITPEQRAFLAKILRQYEAFTSETASDPDSLNGLATAYDRIARIHLRIEQPGPAKAAYDRAIAQFEKLLPLAAHQDAAKHGMAAVLSNRAMVQQRLQQNDQAIVDYQKALAIMAELPSSQNTKLGRANLARTRTGLGVLYYRLGKFKEARPLQEQAVESWRKLLAEDAKDVNALEGLADSLNNLASLAVEERQLAVAGRLRAEVVDLREQQMALQPANTIARARLALSLSNLAMNLAEVGQPEAAQKHYRLALDHFAQARREQPLVPAYQADWARTSHHLAKVLTSVKDYAAADAALKPAESLLDSLCERFPEHADYQVARAGADVTRGIWHRQQNQFDQAGKYWQAAQKRLEAVLAKEPRNNYARQLLDATRNNLKFLEGKTAGT